MSAPPILLSTEQIQERVRGLAAEIEADHADAGRLHLVCVLKGAFVFLADLVRALRIPSTLDFMAVSSYAKGTTTTGEVRLLKDLDMALDGRHVVIVEDIVDYRADAHLPAGHPARPRARRRCAPRAC